MIKKIKWFFLNKSLINIHDQIETTNRLEIESKAVITKPSITLSVTPPVRLLLVGFDGVDSGFFFPHRW